MDENGYIQDIIKKMANIKTMTSVEGVFVAGDCN